MNTMGQKDKGKKEKKKPKKEKPEKKAPPGTRVTPDQKKEAPQSKPSP
jgi:hypothetical protein